MGGFCVYSRSVYFVNVMTHYNVLYFVRCSYTYIRTHSHTCTQHTQNLNVKCIFSTWLALKNSEDHEFTISVFNCHSYIYVKEPIKYSKEYKINRIAVNFLSSWMYLETSVFGWISICLNNKLTCNTLKEVSHLSWHLKFCAVIRPRHQM